MTESHEFDEKLRKAPRYRMPEAVQEQHLRMLAELAQSSAADEARDAASTPAKRSRKSHRKWLVVAASVVVVGAAGVGTAAAFGLFTAPPTDRRIATCFATADLQATDNQFDIAVAAPDGGNPSEYDAATFAMDICTGAWQQGRLSATDPKFREDPLEPPWDYLVPPLVACVLPSGQVGVLPGPVLTCEQLGLPIAEL